MADLLHRIKVFVYRRAGWEPNYLLLKPHQESEGMWGPVQGPIAFDEKLETAIRRRVLDETGIAPPGQLVDLQMPQRVTFGDEEIVEWCFGYGAASQPDPRRFERHGAAFRWAAFAEAYPSLEFEADRAAIMRLHAFLHAA
jgi:ADP-ribose pyrophosphatase YjhB (NUDIX family)